MKETRLRIGVLILLVVSAAYLVFVAQMEEREGITAVRGAGIGAPSAQRLFFEKEEAAAFQSTILAKRIVATTLLGFAIFTIFVWKPSD